LSSNGVVVEKISAKVIACAKLIWHRRQMPRARKRHVQQSLQYLDRNGQRRGIDKHYRPGRPPKGKRSSERHEVRLAVKPSDPIYVTIRATRDVGKLRKRHLYRAIRCAMLTAFRRTDFRIVHMSIQATHIHLLVEAADRDALAVGMQGFQISAAKQINAAIAAEEGTKRRRGSVFPDRYHAEIITSRRRARHCLAYVLNNWRRHREDKFAFAAGLDTDPFSTAPSFTCWRSRVEMEWPPSYEPLPAAEPKTWLLREGWKMYGLIDPGEVPGDKP
jgi:REP element-mobilizing transposase RayT